ncbi:Predicted P-loop ATPase, KAP-like [Janthinobacterium sp. OK676]|uniref:KAP family P-loop NTPase fold protein n=1 Tax=Janthinobacterium sp. OK676 TaxID=1855295 RepID=UPI0008879F2F|nr:P-loop NTPase fold protein [Janthinobacterium sp. OK676]SDL47268.1 Predicted P-loop ATPase, KAP-like [Janthinobacterium sp. OK676]
MWTDIETKTDLLNFRVVADTAAQLIRDAGGQPLSIGVSGNWGVGKSSLVKMIGESLKTPLEQQHKYVFLEFNAWLYQGYDDARMALLQAVSDKLSDEAKQNDTILGKIRKFAKRIKWLRVGTLVAPAAAGAFMGGTVAGPVGAVIGAVGGLFQSGGMPDAEALGKVKEAYVELQPDLKELIAEKEHSSLPQEIEALRKAFAEILSDLQVTLVVLVDDLDRCLPNTAISTLEAMRLLLFVPRTAFIIAADEQMIRGAVRSHFGAADIGDELVTSYFDKLIQIPLRVPRLGVNEVKAYVILLLAELAERRGRITLQERAQAQAAILDAVRKSWSGALTRQFLHSVFASFSDVLSMEVDMADQLSGILTTAEQISGNPRLIKRFLNSLLIRESIAKAQGMSIGFEELVKLQLFERCASPGAFDYLVKCVNESEGGKLPMLGAIESALSKEEEIKLPDKIWDTPFIIDWLKLSPPLAAVDLRPLLHLSRDRKMTLANFDELSINGRKMLDALLEADRLMTPLVTQLQSLGETESEAILARLMRRARSDQWTLASLVRCLNVLSAHPPLAPRFIALLTEMPANMRQAALVPQLRKFSWAKQLLADWASDSDSPSPLRKALSALAEKK